MRALHTRPLCFRIKRGVLLATRLELFGSGVECRVDVGVVADAFVSAAGQVPGAAAEESASVGKVQHHIGGIGITQYAFGAGKVDFDAGAGDDGLGEGVVLYGQHGLGIRFFHSITNLSVGGFGMYGLHTLKPL